MGRVLRFCCRGPGVPRAGLQRPLFGARRSRPERPPATVRVVRGAGARGALGELCPLEPAREAPGHGEGSSWRTVPAGARPERPPGMVRGVRAAGVRGVLENRARWSRTEKPLGMVRGVRAALGEQCPLEPHREVPGQGEGCEGGWSDGTLGAALFPGIPPPRVRSARFPAPPPAAEGSGRGAGRPEGRLWWRGALRPTLRPGHVVPALQLGADPVAAGAGAGQLVSAAEGCGGEPRAAAAAQRAPRRQRRRCPGSLWGGAGGWDWGVLLAPGAPFCPWGLSLGSPLWSPGLSLGSPPLSPGCLRVAAIGSSFPVSRLGSGDRRRLCVPCGSPGFNHLRGLTRCPRRPRCAALAVGDRQSHKSAAVAAAVS